jgi:hypothetical protein
MAASGIPVSDRSLTENFMRVALYDEYRRGSGGFVREETESRLRRWEVPVRVGIRFGASVPPDRQATDRARIVSFVARLAQITGHPMSWSTTATRTSSSISCPKTNARRWGR